jgi:succinyl-diaminopimelate desuccinylase
MAPCRFLGDCAVRHMGAVLAEMEATLFPLLAGKRTEMPVVPEGARSSTLNINAIHGGEPEQDPDYTGLPAPCVPDRCRITIDRRFLIEEDIAEVKAEVTALMERCAPPDLASTTRSATCSRCSRP